MLLVGLVIVQLSIPKSSHKAYYSDEILTHHIPYELITLLDNKIDVVKVSGTAPIIRTVLERMLLGHFLLRIPFELRLADF